ncbi:MAG: carbohydrate binding family 9 domain-containing protein [Gemmatimonadaceae bacterium]|nr:carbohydrate binding family 9 domain-containing protein [Gemmatimonadaceae bacterium]
MSRRFLRSIRQHHGRRIVAGLLLFFAPNTGAAQSAAHSTESEARADRALPTSGRGDVHHARNGQTEVSLGTPRTDQVTIDGRLDEAVWAAAPMLTGFSLYQPTDGQPAPDSTEVRIWHSRDAIYIGIRAFEPHGIVRATLADRDRLTADDYVEIHLDPFLERRRAFVFIVNPFGIQADGTKSEGGGFIPGSNISPGQNDLSADFLWQSRGRLTDEGYEVEIRIPTVSLRFPQQRVQRWGIQVNRKVQHSGYEQTWTPVQRGAASFIGQQGYLRDIQGLERGVDALINPELTNTTAGAPTTVAPGSGASSKWSYSNTGNVGGNVRVGLGSNFVLNGSIRPDFSQVEADATQVAADPRFALFYPERRPFFVEGADAFNAPNTLLYTRRIVQPTAALKLTGRLGRSNIAVLSALDAPAGTSSSNKPWVNVMRLTRDFATQSQAGLVYSDRISDAATHRLVSTDVRHVFGKYYASAQLAGSDTRLGTQTTRGLLWEAVMDRTGRQWGFHYNLLGVQPGFRSENGFVARTGFIQPNISNRFTVFGTPGRLFERYQLFTQVSGISRYDDFFRGRSLLETRANAGSTVTFRRGWSVGYTPTLSTYAFDPAQYATLQIQNAGDSYTPFVPSPRITTFAQQFSLTTPQFRRFAASGSVIRSNDVDFEETARVRRTAVNASLDWRPNTQLRVNATYASNEFIRRLDGSSSFSTQIPRIKAEYQMTRSFFVRLITQYEASRREALRDWQTGAPLGRLQGQPPVQLIARRQSNLLRADWLFAYRPSPGTVVFAGYGSSLVEQEALAFDGLRRVNDGIFVKASWVTRLGAR